MNVTDLDAFFSRTGLASAHVARQLTPLTGGVSSDIWRVDFSDGRTVCVKRALAKLKVAADWQAPVSRNAYEWAWMQFASTVLPHAVPQPLAHDESLGMFAMTYLEPAAHPVWKQQLLSGHVDPASAAMVGQAMGPCHQYPDGMMLFLGTMFAPTQDRHGPGQGFTHVVGDVVSVSTPQLGTLTNTITTSDQAAPWVYGVRALMRDLARRGLLA